MLNFQQITMPYLAARVPSDWQVSTSIRGRSVEWSDRHDLVAITFHTPSAFHALQPCGSVQVARICVVMGGPHVTLLPEEAGRTRT